MSNSSVDIRVYRAKELRALDMAELLRAAISGNTVLHGCAVTFNSTTGRLTISDGRLIMYGRLGVVTGGDIPMPESPSVSTYYLVAVCNLTAETPMTISLMTTDEKNTIVSAANENTDDSFNPNNGVRYLIFGTATIDTTLNVVTAWTPVADAAVVHNISYYITTLNNKITTTVNAAKSELTTKINKVADSGSSAHSVATAMSWITYLRKRLHSYNNFAVDSRTAGNSTDGYFIVAAGKTATICYPKAKDGVTRICANTAVRTNLMNQYRQQYTGGTAVPTILCKPNGTIYDELPGNTVNWSTSNDRYGVPQAADPRYTPYAVVGVNISGTNSANCVIQSFGFTGGHAYVTVRNVGSAQASLSVSVRIFYIQAE